MLPYLLPRPGVAIERDLLRRGICIGADGSVLQDGSRVYAVHADVLWGRLHTVYYFHGFPGGSPVCQQRTMNSISSQLILSLQIVMDTWSAAFAMCN